MIITMMIARLARKCHKPKAEHVERRHQRAQQRQDDKQPRVTAIGAAIIDRLFDDCIFGMEPAETEHERNTNARDREAADQHGVSGDRHFMPQAAHLAHVIRVDGVNHGAAAQEQEAFEKRMRNKVKQTSDPTAETEGKHHEAELAHGRVREHALDIDGGDRDRGSEE